MFLNGGTIAGVARATSPVRENDRSRPWREIVHFSPGETTTLTASDGFIVARATIPQPSKTGGCLRRRDAERFDKEDAIDVDDGSGDGEKRFLPQMVVAESDVKVELVETVPGGDVYPDGPGKTIALHPGGRPSFRCDPKALRRALQTFILADVTQVEVFVQPKIGDGMLFLRGTGEDDTLFEVAIGFPKTAERKSKSGEIVEVFEATPLFPGAEKPAPDPNEAERVEALEELDGTYKAERAAAAQD